MEQAHTSSDFIGTCQSEELINELFGSVIEFAQLVALRGNRFTQGVVRVEYDEKTDIHSFYFV